PATVSPTPPRRADIQKILAELADIARDLDAVERDPGRWDAWLSRLAEVAASAQSLAPSPASPAAHQLSEWARALPDQGAAWQRLSAELAPGLRPGSAPTLAGLAAAPGPHHKQAGALAERFANLSERAEALASGMDFSFLYDAERELFAIGYHLS